MFRFLKLSVLVFFVASTVLIGAKDSKNTGPFITFEEVAGYIKKNGRLPENYITKKDAKKMGWRPGKNLSSVLPGKSIGGDIFQNRERRLPFAKGRVWYEADINYKKGKRGKDRLLFSSDGLFYKTEDHYRTFQRMEI